MFSVINYGGKVTEEEDKQILKELLNTFINHDVTSEEQYDMTGLAQYRKYYNSRTKGYLIPKFFSVLQDIKS